MPISDIKKSHPLTSQNIFQSLSAEGLKTLFSTGISFTAVYFASLYGNLPPVALQLLPGALSTAAYTSAFKVLMPILGNDVDNYALRLSDLLEIDVNVAKDLLMQQVACSSIVNSRQQLLSHDYIFEKLNAGEYKISRAEIVQLFPEDVSGRARPWVIKSVMFEALRMGVGMTASYLLSNHTELTEDAEANRAIIAALGLAAANAVVDAGEWGLAWYQARKVAKGSAAPERSAPNDVYVTLTQDDPARSLNSPLVGGPTTTSNTDELESFWGRR
ncbi:MAG: hypothetical protein K0R66_438 [Gammaproteobacteria bacterium]|jgi:hypothetical protein|nr:hypothetical protein [Gammaproteobacteria bacterium]